MVGIHAGRWVKIVPFNFVEDAFDGGFGTVGELALNFAILKFNGNGCVASISVALTVGKNVGVGPPPSAVV